MLTAARQGVILVSMDAQTAARDVRINAFFTLVFDKRNCPSIEITGLKLQSCVPQRDPNTMEDFIERTLRERRSLQVALTDMLAKHDHIPSGNERAMLERMIAILKDEIALRQNGLRVAK